MSRDWSHTRSSAHRTAGRVVESSGAEPVAACEVRSAGLNGRIAWKSDETVRSCAYLVRMRAKDIKTGEQYTLSRAGGRLFRVTVLPTPPEIREQGRLLVRFEEGVLRGRVTEQLPRFIVAPVGATQASNQTGAQAVSRPLTVPGTWPPNAGDPVTWPAGAGPLEWRVLAVDPARGEARISGRVLEMRQEHRVPLADLEPVPIVLKSRMSSTDTGPSRSSRPRAREDPPPPDLRSPLERAVDRLEFTPECLRQYQREFATDIAWRDIGKRLRRELRNNGRLLRQRTEYLRIRTSRFDIIVTERPSDEEPFMVERLVPRRLSRRRTDTGHKRSGSPRRRPRRR